MRNVLAELGTVIPIGIVKAREIVDGIGSANSVAIAMGERSFDRIGVP